MRKARRSESLMHRRNSSSEFCGHTLSASWALNSERKAAVGNAAYIHKRGVGILEQAFNHDLRFASIHNLRVEDLLSCTVSANHASIPRVGGIFFCHGPTLALIGLNKDR